VSIERRDDAEFRRAADRLSSAARERRGLEQAFEQLLWSSRFLVLIAVVASLLVALVMFFVASADVVYLLHEVVHYVDPNLTGDARARLHAGTVADVAEVVDGYLFAAIMIIFALGLYELFVSKIDAAERSEFASRLLLIQTLDDLKERLATVVFLILVVRYFQFALQLPLRAPLDLLYLPVGIALIAAALYLTQRYLRPSRHRGESGEPRRGAP
jgi:uncharacterized membrane protein YqhA